MTYQHLLQDLKDAIDRLHARELQITALIAASYAELGGYDTLAERDMDRESLIERLSHEP